MSVFDALCNQMWIYCASLKTLHFCGLINKYSAQADLIIDNMRLSAMMLRIEAEKELREVQMSVNVKV